MALVLRILACLCLLRGVWFTGLSYSSDLDRKIELYKHLNWKLTWFIEQFGLARGVRCFGLYNMLVGVIGMSISFWI